MLIIVFFVAKENGSFSKKVLSFLIKSINLGSITKKPPLIQPVSKELFL